jgi:hypothetical protein
MKCVVFVLFILTTLPVFAEDKPANEPGDLVKLREAYEAKVKTAVEPITAAYLKRLEGMKRTYGANGDLVSAQAVQNEINSLATDAPKRKNAVAIVGKWIGSNHINYEFYANNTSKCSNGVVGKWQCLDKKKRMYRVTWADGGFDRIVISADGDAFDKVNQRGETHTGSKLHESEEK